TGYLVLVAAHTTAAALGTGSAVIGLGWGLILTGVYPVVLRNAGVDRIGIAAAVTLLFRNVALSVGVTVAVVVITNAGLSGPFPAESGYTRAFLIGAAGAAATFLPAILLPKSTPAPAEVRLVLYGRARERGRIGDLLEAARASRSNALVIRGEPGIGKTALLEDTRERAADMHVLTARGVESEAELPFAALHQLLRPVLSHVEQLPAPQADALRGALGLAQSSGQERFL